MGRNPTRWRRLGFSEQEGPKPPDGLDRHRQYMGEYIKPSHGAEHQLVAEPGICSAHRRKSRQLVVAEEWLPLVVGILLREEERTPKIDARGPFLKKLFYERCGNT